MNITHCIEEILAIGSLNAELIAMKKNAFTIKWICSGIKTTLESEKTELTKNTEYRKSYKPCTKEEEAELKVSLSNLECQLSALKLFDIKKRKELKEKIEILRKQQQKAFNYLYYCDKISKLEESIAKNENDYTESVKRIESLTQKTQALENEISTRVDAVLSQIGKSDKVAAKIAGSITCSPTLLPSKLLSVLITDNESPLLVGLPIDKQVKLLWERNIPLRFGGMEWNVVEIEKNRARLILRGTVYDGIGFSEVKNGGWDNSYGRKKLNGEFLDKFTDEEKSYIIPNDKSFGDKFTILGKEDLDNYLDPYQRNVPTNWWLKYSFIDTYSEDKQRSVYYWDSFYEGNYRTYSDPISIADSNAHYGHNHILGYRPLVLVRLNDDPDDANWLDLWHNTTEASIICRGKWTVSNNCVPPHVKFSSSDVSRIMQRLNGGSSSPTRNPLDDFNSNGTPSGHGGHF